MDYKYIEHDKKREVRYSALLVLLILQRERLERCSSVSSNKKDKYNSPSLLRATDVSEGSCCQQKQQHMRDEYSEDPSVLPLDTERYSQKDPTASNMKDVKAKDSHSLLLCDTYVSLVCIHQDLINWKVGVHKLYYCVMHKGF